MCLLYKEEVYKLIGAAMEVYNLLGNGFLESVYQEALEYELDLRGIPYKAQEMLQIKYKDKMLEHAYKADLVLMDKIIVELKAMEKLGRNEKAQIINYLKATNLELGVLINFGAKNDLEWKRMILSKNMPLEPEV